MNIHLYFSDIEMSSVISIYKDHMAGKGKRQWKDPESAFSERMIKDKFNFVDNLDESADKVPKGQGYLVTTYVEADPCLTELTEVFFFGEFVKKALNTVVKKAIEKKDFDFLLKQYKNYKQINHEHLNRKFAETYGDDYDGTRMQKAWGAFRTEKAAQKFGDSISDELKEIGLGYHIQQMGYFVPFNPSKEDCENFSTTNKKMNELMGGHMTHKALMKRHFNDRRNILRQKQIDENLKRLKETSDKSKDDKTKKELKKAEVKAGEKIDLSGYKKLSKEELEDEFDMMTSEHLLNLKHKNESVKHEKMIKDIVDLEMKINEGAGLNPEIIDKIGSMKDSEKDKMKDKIKKSKVKMHKEVEKINRENMEKAKKLSKEVDEKKIKL